MKKLIALLMILAVVLTGVFAVPDIQETATVTLTGEIGEFFRHGVVDGSNLVPQKVYNEPAVFSADGKAFAYGYKSNIPVLNAELYMNYTDFKHTNDTDTIQIAAIHVNGSNVSYDTNKGGFLIFADLDPNGGTSITSKTVTIFAAQTAAPGAKDAKNQPLTHAVEGTNAPGGTYTATLTFSVVNK